MSTIVIEGKSAANMELIMQLAKKLGARVKKLSVIEKEDLALGTLMNEVKTGKKVSKATILRKLKC